ncbi:MAG TPA: hypothetical protein VIT91_00275, partial [Chthoniobacterales bacterium]
RVCFVDDPLPETRGYRFEANLVETQQAFPDLSLEGRFGQYSGKPTLEVVPRYACKSLINNRASDWTRTRDLSMNHG